jgi:hypothetical protein
MFLNNYNAYSLNPQNTKLYLSKATQHKALLQWRHFVSTIALLTLSKIVARFALLCTFSVNSGFVWWFIPLTPFLVNLQQLLIKSIVLQLTINFYKIVNLVVFGNAFIWPSNATIGLLLLAIFENVYLGICSTDHDVWLVCVGVVHRSLSTQILTYWELHLRFWMHNRHCLHDLPWGWCYKQNHNCKVGSPVSNCTFADQQAASFTKTNNRNASSLIVNMCFSKLCWLSPQYYSAISASSFHTLLESIHGANMTGINRGYVVDMKPPYDQASVDWCHNKTQCTLLNCHLAGLLPFLWTCNHHQSESQIDRFWAVVKTLIDLVLKPPKITTEIHLSSAVPTTHAGFPGRQGLMLRMSCCHPLAIGAFVIWASMLDPAPLSLHFFWLCSHEAYWPFAGVLNLPSQVV